MEDLEIFKEIAKENYRKQIENPISDEQLENAKLLAEGICSICGSPIDMIETKRDSSHVEFKYPCGHRTLQITLLDATRLIDDYTLASLKAVKGGGLISQARISNKVQKSVDREIHVCKTLAFGYKSELTQFVQCPVEQKIDVIGKNSDGSIQEYFQVTRLYPEDFWKKLSYAKESDITTDNITEWVEDVIKRKMAIVEPSLRQKMILVIDAWPGLPNECELRHSLVELLDAACFKEVWLVGETKDLTFQLY